MKRILIINGHLNAGGIERSLIDLLQHINYSKFVVDLLLLQGKGDYIQEIPAQVNIYAYNIQKAYGPFISTLADNLIHKNWFHIWYRTIIHFLGLKYLSILIPTLRKEYITAIAYRPGICTDILVKSTRSKKKISWWHHGEMHLCQEEENHLYSEYRKLQQIIAVSDCSANLLKQHFPAVRDKITVIPNMICDDFIINKASRYCKLSFQSNLNKLHIISVGRLSPEKNMSFCILVAQALKELAIHFEWILVGDGEEYDKISNKIVSHNLENAVCMVGSLSNPYPLMKSADLLFHPSLVESQGLTILEAMALGTPVICVKSAGPSEFIVNEENGIMIQNDVNEAVSAITHLSNDVQLRKSIAQKAKATINAFAPETIIQKIEELL